MSGNKIVFLIGSLGGGGAEKVCVNLANQFAENKIQVTLIVLNLYSSIYHSKVDNRIKLINLNVKHARNSIIALGRYIINYNPDKFLVFNHQLALILVILKVALRKKYNIISRNISNLTQKKLHETSIWHRHVVNFFVKIIYRYVDKIIAQSNGMKEDLIRNFKISENKIKVIYNPISPDIERVFKNIQLAKIAKRNEIVFIGRLSYVKGLNYLIDAFKIVNQSDRSLKLRIVGTGPLQNDLKKMAEDYNLLDNIIFEGFQKEIAEYLLFAKMTILTSIYEGFPNVLIESIALGTPVVSFDCPSGPKEIIHNGVNGYLALSRNVNDLVDKIFLCLKKEWDPIAIQKTSNRYNSFKIFTEYEKEIIENV